MYGKYTACSTTHGSGAAVSRTKVDGGRWFPLTPDVDNVEGQFLL